MTRGDIDEIPVGKSEYERADFWIARRDFVDEVIEKPARTLVRLVRRSLDCREGGTDATFTVPVAIDAKWDERSTYQGGSLLVHAVACSAVQSLYDDRRRYPWLDSVKKDLGSIHDRIPEAFFNHPALQEKDLLDRLDVLGDPVFGALNPVTAAEVFWVLIRAGERYAHGQVGFLALFSLLWALKRQTHGRFIAGASLGHWRPSVAITARCLLPILQLTRIISRRARLYREAADLCGQMHENEQATTEYQRWKFASALERLSAVLHRLAEISIDRRDVERVAESVTALADPIAPQTATGPIAEEVRRQLRTLFVKLGEQNASILKGAREATFGLQTELIAILGRDDERRRLLRKKCNVRPMWDEQLKGASQANETCAAILDELERVVSKSHDLPPENAFTHDVLVSTLEQFAQVNDKIEGILREAISENEEWCRSSVTREVAFASAGNDSEFDAAELLSGLVIAQGTEKITRAAIEDAIRHSLRSARSDGSWASDQPIYVEKHFVGVWPGTADLLFLLSTAVHSRHGLVSGDVADRHLLRYVDLLEARRRKNRPTWWDEKEAVWGFPSESREDFIDVWETAMSVRALLEIREVIEDRLWEICDDRFTIRQPQMELAELDPVDLGARHGKRLQTRLIRTAAKTRSGHSGAEYAYVLHGPPGSSKSAIAEAIAREMWTPDSRFIRITPADFTRRGEDGVDFEARFIFRLLSHVRRVTILFDEIDDLLRKRKVDAELAFIRLVIPGMLNRLQDLREAAPRQEICFLLATNYVDQIEPALTRRGRIDAAIPVPYPDSWSRESILDRNVSRTQAERAIADLPRSMKDAVVSRTAAWPWATYQKLCRKVIDDGCRTVDDVQVLIDEFSADFEPADYYYKNSHRWKTTSPLVNEFAHFTFGASKSEHECRRQVTELEAHLRSYDDVPVDDLKLVERFDHAWRDTERG
jgi:hypothetical protein